MADQIVDGISDDGWMDEYVAVLRSHRAQTEDVRNAFRDQSLEFHATLDRRFSELSEALSGFNQDDQERRSELERREQQLEDRALNVEVRIAHLDQLKHDLAEQRGEWLRLQAESANLQQSLLDEIREQHEQLNECRAQLESERAELDQREQALVSNENDSNDDKRIRGELIELREERQRLQKRLSETELLIDQSTVSESDSEELEHLRRRLQMALDDLREMESSNEELQEQLSAAKSASGDDGSVEGAKDDSSWEAQKRKILAQLESESDDSLNANERLKVDDVIRATDRVVEERQREVDELKKLLDQQSNSIGDVAVGAAAIGEMFDQDELIRQERENLRELQEQWHSKLRDAEIEISTERAKLAREKIALEEKLAVIEQATKTEIAPANECDERKTGLRNWLARLGNIKPNE